MRSFLVAQWVKDPALSLQRLWSLLWLWFHPCPGNVRMLWVHQKEKDDQLVPEHQSRIKVVITTGSYCHW